MEKILHYRPNGKNPKKWRAVTVAARTANAENPDKVVVVAAWARVGINEHTRKPEPFSRKEGRRRATERLDVPNKARIVFLMDKSADLIHSMAAIAQKVSRDFLHYHKRHQEGGER